MSHGVLCHHSWSHILPGWTLRGHHPVLQCSLSSSQIWRLITDRLVCPPLPSSDSGHMTSRDQPWPPPRRPIQEPAFQHVSQIRGTCPSLRDSHQPRSLCHDAPRSVHFQGTPSACIFHQAFFSLCVSQRLCLSLCYLPTWNHPCALLCLSTATNAGRWAPAPPRVGGSAEGVGSPRIIQPFHGAVTIHSLQVSSPLCSLGK